MRRYRLILLGAVLLVAGCGRKPADDEASIRKQLDRKGTIDLMDQVARAPDYKPPADGHLTERQVRMYLDVRLREQKIREVAFKNLNTKSEATAKEKRPVGVFEALKRIGDIADVATADVRAAQELSFNPKEYQWVRDRVMEAQMLQATRALNQQVALSREALLRSLAEQKKTAGADQQAEIDRHIQDLRKSAEEVVDRDPAKIFNAQLLGRYEDSLARLQSEDQRISQELQKGPTDGH
jgi:uncharacterized protein YicC (UPF0701 family)